MGGFLHAKYEFQNLVYHGVSSFGTLAFFAFFSETVPKHPGKQPLFPPIGHSEDETPRIALIFLKKKLPLNLVIGVFSRQTDGGDPRKKCLVV